MINWPFAFVLTRLQLNGRLDVGCRLHNISNTNCSGDGDDPQVIAIGRICCEDTIEGIYGCHNCVI